MQNVRAQLRSDLDYWGDMLLTRARSQRSDTHKTNTPTSDNSKECPRPLRMKVPGLLCLLFSYCSAAMPHDFFINLH